jgi:prepilin-type N-terminal cleavage/methylation domain-containing protein
MRMTSIRQRGLGLVELMVGITVGLIVAAAASMVAVNQINEHRRLMLETQIQQDLRTAADLLQQDLRRAGFRGFAQLGVWAPPAAIGTLKEQPAAAPSANEFATVTRVDNGDARSLIYLYARTDYSATGALRDAEYFGFKWDKGSKTLYLQIGKGNWQPITDPDIVKITNFEIDVDDSQSIDVGDFCDKPCNPPTAGAPACPKQGVRQVSFKIVGEAAHDSNVKRTLSGVERLRTDQIIGACPA